MSRRVAPSSERSAAELAALAPEALAAIAADGEIEIPSLPRDLPPWARDAVALSHRTRELLARIKPVIVRVLTFWDHRVRSAFVGGNRLTIDPSGSYRVDR